MVEDIDKVFIGNHYGSSAVGGDLYKCVWGTNGSGSWQGANLTRTDAVETSYDATTGYCNGARTAKGRIGVEDNYASYHPNYQLKTNDDGEASDFSKMAGLINAVHSCRYEKAPLSVLESVLDIEEFLHFDAIGFLFGNFDDQRMNYNNYYLYFRPSDGKAVYIPYEWDWSLGNSDSHDMVNLDPFYTTSLDGSANSNNLYYDTILSGSKNSDYSLDAMKAAYTSYIKGGVSAGLLDKANYVTFTSSALDKGDVSSVSTYMDSKKSYLSSHLA